MIGFLKRRPDVHKLRQDGNLTGLVSAATYPRDAKVRHLALKALRESAVFRDEGVFLTGLEDDNPEVRNEAAKGLGRVGTSKATFALVAALGDQDTSVSGSAALALGYMGAADAKAPLIEAWNHGNHSAAYALAELGSPEGVNYFCSQLDSIDRTTRWDAAMALATVGPAGVEPLITAFRSGGKQVRIAVAWAFEESPAPQALEILGEASESKDWDLRKAAKDALRALQELLHSDGEV